VAGPFTVTISGKKRGEKSMNSNANEKGIGCNKPEGRCGNSGIATISGEVIS